VGLRLDEALDGQRTVTVLGVRRAAGDLVVKPGPGLALEPGYELIVVGAVEDLERITSQTRPAASDRRTAIAEP
jgi:K+/H+ antiporter YhaU regulatory subunit KhtT